MYILDNYDTLSAILALMKLQCSYGRITHITGNAGSNLLEGNINLPLIGEEGKKLFDLMTSYRCPPRSQSRNYVESRVRGIKTILNKLMSLYNESIRKEVLELFLEQVCDIVNCTPYKTDAESIHLSPSCFLGFKKAPDLLWTREVKDNGKIGRALNSVLIKLKNWHLCNIKKRSDQIQSSTSHCKTIDKKVFSNTPLRRGYSMSFYK